VGNLVCRRWVPTTTVGGVSEGVRAGAQGRQARFKGAARECVASAEAGVASARESRRECWVDELEWPPESAGRGGGGVGGGEPTKMEQRWCRWRRIEPLDPRVRVRRIEGTSWVFTRAQ
jgi:hypothetical protein